MAAIQFPFGRAKPQGARPTALARFVADAYRGTPEPKPDLIRVIKAYLDTQKKRT